MAKKEMEKQIGRVATLTLIAYWFCMLVHGPIQGTATKAVVELLEGAINPLSFHDEPEHTTPMQQQPADGGDVGSCFGSFK